MTYREPPPDMPEPAPKPLEMPPPSRPRPAVHPRFAAFGKADAIAAVNCLLGVVLFLAVVLLVIVLLSGCKKPDHPVVAHDAGPFDRIDHPQGDAGPTGWVTLCGKPTGVRDLSDARVESSHLLGRLVVCESSSQAGSTCWDTRGSMVWCPRLMAEPCVRRPDNTPTAVEAP